MNNFLSTYTQGLDLPVFEYVAGEEKLSFPEHLREWFTGIYLAIQKLYAKFTFNIHKVDMTTELSLLKKDSTLFYKHGSVECPTPEYFVKTPMWMTTYVKSLNDGAVLMDILTTESATMYSRMKKFASTGVVPPTFKWVVTDTDKVIDRAEAFMSALKQNRGSFMLKEVYSNPDEIASVVNIFNTTVRNFKSRDSEMLSAELKRVYDIASLSVEKLKVGDIPTNKDEILMLEGMFKTFSRLTNITGAMLVLLNEMAAVLDDTKTLLKDLT